MHLEAKCSMGQNYREVSLFGGYFSQVFLQKKEDSTKLTVRLTMVPNFSKWLLSFVIEFDSRGIFLTISVSDGCRGIENDWWCGRGQ